MKIQLVKQHNEEDCGAACLASIIKYYGKALGISQIREAVGTGQQGTTLLGLRQGAEALGFNARPVKTSADILDRMNEAPLPAIIHWMGCHWVVLYGKRGRKYVIADPAFGVRYLSKKDLVQGWLDWVILLLEPDPNRFFVQANDKPTGFRRFILRVWPYRGIILQATLCSFMVGLLSLALPFLMQILTDDVLVRGDMKLLTNVVIAVVIMKLISGSLSWVQSNLVAQFAQRFQLGLVFEFARQILQLPLAYYESRRSGEIVSRLRDIQQINQLVSEIVVSLPSQFFVGLISLAFMLVYSHQLTLAAGLISILMTLSTLILLPHLRHKIRNVMVLEAENQGILVESFKGALTLKTTAAHPQFWDEFQGRFSRLANQMLDTTQISILNNAFSQVVSDVGMITLLWYGSRFVIAGELSIGQLLAFNAMNQNFLGLISMLIKFVDEFAKVKTATERLLEVVDATPENLGDGQKTRVEIPCDADIICNDLNFHYPGRLELLENFSLVIPGGKVIALIGKSGCGKSTLAKLIAGLHPLQDGNIRIGLYNLQDLSLDCLRQQVVLVPQDAHFWNRSVIENFRLGNPSLGFDQIIQACRIADADGFMSQLPSKYQTVLGEFGANISGGQRQRLAIARSISNDPPILILDESTAGLDPVSESLVLDQLLAHRKGKTTILISHRPRVINRADWIVLLDQGRLVVQGPPSLLTSMPGDHLDFLFENPAQARKAKIEAFLKQGLKLFNNGDSLSAIEDYNRMALT